MAWVKLADGSENNISTDWIECPPEVSDFVQARNFLSQAILGNKVKVGDKELMVVEVNIMAFTHK